MTNNNNNHNTNYPSDSHLISYNFVNKMMGKKITFVAGIFLVILLGLSTVMANQLYSAAQPKTSQGPTALMQAQNQFEYRYEYNCNEGCTVNFDGDKIRLEVREQKRFLFFNVETISNYELNEESQVVQARHNIWAMLLNRNRIREVA